MAGATELNVRLRLLTSADGTLKAELLALNEGVEGLGKHSKAAGDGLTKMQREAATVFTSTRTSAEKLAIELNRLDEMYRKGAIDQDTFARATQKAKHELDEATIAAHKNAEAVREGAGELANEGLMLASLVPGLGNIGLLAGTAATAFGPLIVVIASALADLEMFKQILETGFETDQIEKHFHAILGSAGEARQELERLEEFSLHAHFKLPELADADTFLRIFKLDAEELLPVLDRTASALGVSLDQMTTAIDLATLGQVRGLKRLGIDIREVQHNLGMEIVAGTQLTRNQAVALVKEIAREYQVTLADAVDTPKEKVTQLGNAFEVLRSRIWHMGLDEFVGTQLTRLVNAMGKLLDLFDKFSMAMARIRVSNEAWKATAEWFDVVILGHGDRKHATRDWLKAMDLSKKEWAELDAGKNPFEKTAPINQDTGDWDLHKDKTPKEAKKPQYEYAIDVGPTPEEARMAMMGFQGEPTDAEKQRITDYSQWVKQIFAEAPKIAAQAFNEVSDASEKAADRFRKSWERAAHAVSSVFTRWIDGSIKSLRDLARELARTVASMLAQSAASRLSTLVENAVTAKFHPHISAGGSVGDFPALFSDVGHSGGFAGMLPQSRMVPAMAFAGARRYHSGGLMLDEVPAILQRGEEVLTRRDPRHTLNGGRANSTVVINQTILAPDAASWRRTEAQHQQRVGYLTRQAMERNL